MEHHASTEQRRELRLQPREPPDPRGARLGRCPHPGVRHRQLPHAAGRVVLVVGDQRGVRAALHPAGLGAPARPHHREARTGGLGPVQLPARRDAGDRLPSAAHGVEPGLHRRRDDGVRPAHPCLGVRSGPRPPQCSPCRSSPSRHLPTVDVADDTLVCVAALLISAVLLRLRIKALDELAESQVQLDHQATYDPTDRRAQPQRPRARDPVRVRHGAPQRRPGAGVVRRRPCAQAGQRRARPRSSETPSSGRPRMPCAPASVPTT